MEPESVLSARQVEILDFITQRTANTGYPPSMREIGTHVGLSSTSSVKHHLDVLAERGFIRRDPRRPRTIEILGAQAPAAKVTKLPVVAPPPLADDEEPLPAPTYVPLVGRIAAGNPILAEQHVEDVMPLPRRFTGAGELFMLEVVGDSMVDAAICDGDWVVVRRQAVADNGEIVAAMLDGEATVKTLSRRDGHVWLLPRNSSYPPIPADEATILGKVVTVIRSL
ncbi:transcriptional repressor LexA [Buchananella hordeovulneris]|uniref:LexA repressor n=1 Tax=Buchananella hordeovulneris TaxID=52770 RepID=A0A1Q5PVR7_9ACTO|nr:transcriptional repressor LexA [Buchananella hordeovulneris]OKL51549.1 repressor LexA [Buchananella hordeovulneris]RRD44062.1 transcriptional repressor LexA [Buchananella hordeovulneris]RRD53623.1 transcriptional repressor LexA [Buchananella hordeovulneris]